MADQLTVADSLRMYQTGVFTDGGVEPDPDLSLGNYRGATFVTALGFRVLNPFTNVRIDFVAGLNGDGVGVLSATGADALAWTPPGGSVGASVTVLNGETVVLEGGGTASKYIRVTRTTTDDLLGTANLVLTEEFENTFDDATSAEAAAGDTEYRALMFKNVGATSVTALKVWLGLVGTVGAVDASGYATGAVTITSKGTDPLQDWPESGFVENENTGEVMYYSSRTTEALTVPAAGRDMWGETGGGAGVGDAGSEDDVLNPIPGFRIAKEAPSAQPAGFITDKTGAGEGSQPGGLTWVHPTSVGDADVIDIGTLAASEIYGLWMERIAPVGHVATASLSAVVKWGFTFASLSYTAQLVTRYRVANDALSLYETYIGADGAPDFDSAPAVSGVALPLVSPVLAADTVHHLVTRRRDKYNLVSRNIVEALLSIDAGGVEIEPIPGAPRDIIVSAAAAREIRMRATYYYFEDAVAGRADEFVMWWTTDGSEPNPALTADAVATMTFDGVASYLDFTTSEAFTHGTTVKVLVRSRRNDNGDDFDSSNTESSSAVATREGPEQPDPALVSFARVVDKHTFQGWSLWADEGSGTFINIAPDGSIEFYISSILVLAIDLNGEISAYVPVDNTSTSFGVSNPGVDIDFSAGAWRVFEPSSGNQVLSLSLTMLTIDNSLAFQVVQTDVYGGVSSVEAVDNDGTDVSFNVLEVRVAEVTPTALRSAGPWRYLGG